MLEGALTTHHPFPYSSGGRAWCNTGEGARGLSYLVPYIQKTCYPGTDDKVASYGEAGLDYIGTSYVDVKYACVCVCAFAFALGARSQGSIRIHPPGCFVLPLSLPACPAPWLAVGLSTPSPTPHYFIYKVRRCSSLSWPTTPFLHLRSSAFIGVFAMGILSSLSGQGTLMPILGALLCLYLIRRLVVYLRLARFEGPWWTSFTHWPHSSAILSGRCYEWYAKLSDDYGMGVSRLNSPRCKPMCYIVFLLLTPFTPRRTDCACWPRGPHHLIARSLDARKQTSRLQAV